MALLIYKLVETINGTPWFLNIKPINTVLNYDADWEWLPTSRDQIDPINKNKMLTNATELIGEVERRRIEMSIAKEVMKSMRGLPTNVPGLISGNDNYTEAAKAAAVFAARMACREAILNQLGFWHNVMHEYSKGFWPCGIDKKGALIIL